MAITVIGASATAEEDHATTDREHPLPWDISTLRLDGEVLFCLETPLGRRIVEGQCHWIDCNAVRAGEVAAAIGKRRELVARLIGHGEPLCRNRAAREMNEDISADHCHRY